MTTTSDETTRERSPVSVEDLAERHRRHKALTAGDPVAATITEIGADDQTVYVQLTIDGEPFVTAFEPTTEQAEQLYRIYMLQGLEFQQDLSALRDSQLTVKFDEQLDTMTVSGTDLELPVLSAGHDQQQIEQLPTTLPEPYYQSIQRLVRIEEQPISAEVTGLSVVDDGSVLQARIDVNGTQLDWSLPVPADPAPNNSSVYHQAVECLGHGTVEGIAGSRVFLVRTLRSHPAGPMRDAIDVIEDPLGKWWIFDTEYDARAAASRAILGRDKTDPRTQIGWGLVRGAIYALVAALTFGPILNVILYQGAPVMLGSELVLSIVAAVMGAGLFLILLGE